MTSFPLLELSLDDALDTTDLRSVARRAAGLVGFEDVDCTRIAASVSELGRLVLGQLAPPRPARRREADVCAAAVIQLAVTDLETAVAGRPPSLTITFRNAGAGAALTAHVETSIARLMDAVQITDDAVSISKQLPAAPSASQLAAARDGLLRDSAADHGAMLQSLNDELVAALVALREREADLVQLNAELDATNRGVVALYSQLEQRSAEVRAAQRRVFEELEGALRPAAPPTPGIELAVRYLPAQENSPTGGDLYDWFTLPDGTVHITVVDVQGHGVASTRDALHVTHAVRTLALEGHGIGQLLARADAVLQSTTSTVVATVLIARIDAAAGIVQLAGAGHPPALRVPARGDAVYLEAPGRPLGYDGGGSRGVSVVALEPDDRLLLYTDGLTELRRDVIEGMDRLAAAATAARHLPLSGFLGATVAACAAGETFTDDTLVIAVGWPAVPQ